MLTRFFTEPLALGAAQAVVTIILAAIVVLVARQRRIYIVKESAIAIVRAAVQIVLVGSVLMLLLQAPSWTSVIVLAGMFVAAALTAARRAEGIPGAFWASFYGIAFAAGVVIGVMTWVGAIEPTIQSLVTVGSMVIANAMNSNAMALNRLRGEVNAHTGQIEAALALGAEPVNTLQRYVDASVYASLIPRIDSLRSLGIVWIPGLMTGMIIAGADPVYAAIYQFVVMGMIFATSALSSMITLALIRPSLFSPAGQLLLKPGRSN
jgi:putative ABC transport system permease protein